MELGVMTFNLRMNVAADGNDAWPHRVNAVVKTFLESEAAIIGTQELLPDMLQDLEHALPAYSWVGVPRQPGDECNAIFYRNDYFRVLAHQTFWLSETPDVPSSRSWGTDLPRICTWVHFESISDPRLRLCVYNTHLDHINEHARVNGIQVVLDDIRRKVESGLGNIVMMGDFNDRPSSRAVKSVPVTPKLSVDSGDSRGLAFVNAFDAMNLQAVGRTFHGFQGGVEGEPIDYIFVTPDIEVVRTTVLRHQIDGRYPSDHYPVLSRIRLDDGGAACD